MSYNNTPQPCCQDCQNGDPCNSGCLDIYLSSCIKHEAELTCLGLPVNRTLDAIIQAVDAKFCEITNNGDKFVKVSNLDTQAGYLYPKIKTCDYLTKSIVTEGGQQKLNLCVNVDNLLSDSDSNPIFEDLDGLNINYELLIDTIINTPGLLSALCAAIADC